MSKTYYERLPRNPEDLTRGIVAERLADAQIELSQAQDTLTREWNEGESSTFETRDKLYEAIDLLRGLVEALALRDQIRYNAKIEEESKNAN